MDFFAENSDEKLEELIGITQKSAALLMECAKQDDTAMCAFVTM